ncbi:MAG: hypothetical protein U1F14_10935 [Steroidobacteraceae bacterium]
MNGLLRDDDALGGLLVEFSEERIPSRPERADEDDAFGEAGYDLFAVQLVTLEFFGTIVLILDGDPNALTGGDPKLGRDEPVILQREKNREIRCVGQARQSQQQEREVAHGR